MSESRSAAEARAVHERYARRTRTYDPLEAWVLLTRQELERALCRWARHAFPAGLAKVSLLEIGCGSGANLLQFLRLGMDPGNLAGNELQAERVRQARRVLPAALRVDEGNALDLERPAASVDVVLQSLVFSSILDAGVQGLLARRMWEWVRPGGGVLWYDFTMNNPANPDVRGVPLSRVRALFPAAEVRAWAVTLAPPLSRRVTRLHPALYGWLNLLPWLRTHRLCWLRKPEESLP